MSEISIRIRLIEATEGAVFDALHTVTWRESYNGLVTQLRAPVRAATARGGDYAVSKPVFEAVTATLERINKCQIKPK